jgi:hypothetical protein
MQVLAPLPIGFAVFLVYLATNSITGTGINPARSFGPAVIYGHKKSRDDLVRIISIILCLEALHFTDVNSVKEEIYMDRNEI